MSNVAVAGHSTDRLVAVLTIATAMASIVLLAAHPNEQARTFADVVQEEARNQRQNLIVHGGYIAVLSVQIFCFSFLSIRVSAARLASRGAITFFAIGAAWMCASLLFDGLVTPAVAMRYVDQPDAVRPLFVLISAIVRFVMPIGLGFQGLAVLCWGVAMLATGLRISGAFAFVLGVGLVAAVVVGAFFGTMMTFVAAFVALALWAMIAGIVLLRVRPAA